MQEKFDDLLLLILKIKCINYIICLKFRHSYILITAVYQIERIVDLCKHPKAVASNPFHLKQPSDIFEATVALVTKRPEVNKLAGNFWFKLI